MQTIKFVGLLAGLFLSIGIVLLLILPNPESSNFNKTVEMLFQSGHFSSQQEVLEHYPELGSIQKQMDSLHSLEHSLRIQTQSPVPCSSEKEEKALLAQIQKCKQLRFSIDSSLQAFMRDTVAKTYPKLQSTPPVIWDYLARVGWKVILRR